MQDPAQELKRRREKGRSAQAAFRKRQAEAAQATREENGRLRRALQDIVDAARLGGHAELVSVIRDAAKANGVLTEHLEPVIEVQPRSSDMTYTENECDTQTLQTGDTSNSTDIQTSPGYQPQDPAQKQVMNLHHQDIDRSQHNYRQSSKPTFKSTVCMMWLNPMRYMRIDVPPDDIAPYLGTQAHTLAGRLVWAVLEHARNITDCKHNHHPWPPSSSDRSTMQMVDVAGDSRSSPLASISHEFLRATAEARLEYRRLGYISAEYAAAADPGTWTHVHRRVLEAYRRRGHEEDDVGQLWLDARAVEARARLILGPRGFALLVEGAAGAPENAGVHRSLMAVVDALVAGFVCFGDGPRWRARYVDETFGRWMVEVTGILQP